jgi:xanthine dehydrogenase accessory factor
VEGIIAGRARLANAGIEPETVAPGGESIDIPVLVDPEGIAIAVVRPTVVVDARMAKVNLGTRISDAPLVIALGPGFTAGVDCHAVIETNRGHKLGRVYREGAAEPDTGTPGIVNGRGAERVIRAPRDGHVIAHASVGDSIAEGQRLAEVDGVPIYAAFSGVLRGLIHPRVLARAGQKIGDLDPRGTREHCFTISDKALAIGGGVVEAILSAPQVRSYLVKPHAASH